MKRMVIGMVAVLSALAVAGDSPKPQLRAPEALSPLARQLLRKRMHRHGDEMVRLVVAVTLLQRDRIRALATDVANEPRLTKPIAGGEDDVNAAIPNQFFVFQDDLRNKAKALAEAANKPSDTGIAQALGRVTETCVACHSAYLDPDTVDSARLEKMRRE